MANHALLNNVEHQHLKINPARSTHLGDGVWYSETFVSEFRVAQAHYPIFFTKDDTTNTFSHSTHVYKLCKVWSRTYVQGM